MAWLFRIQYPGAVYHVMNRGSSRQKVFLDTLDYEVFITTIAELHDRWRVEIFAYCLMANHYHVCLRTPEGNLAWVMRHLDGLYTRRFNRLHRRDAALFRGRYKAILIEKDNYLAQVVRYIHLNPWRRVWFGSLSPTCGAASVYIFDPRSCRNGYGPKR